MVDTLGQRLRAAIEAAGLTQKRVGVDIAKRLGRSRPYSAAAVGQWYVDKHKPSYKVLVELTKLVGADLVWIQTGVGGGAGQLPREGRLVPLISIEQAIKQPIDYSSRQTIHSCYACSADAFVIPITDDRNVVGGLGYNVGDRVVIDPLRQPRPGKMVLAVISREGVFGRYVVRPGKVIVIEAINPAWPEEILNPKKGDRIIGAATEHTRPEG